MSIPNSTKYVTEDVLAILKACGYKKPIAKISYVNKPWTGWGKTTKEYVRFRSGGWRGGATVKMVRVSAVQGSPLLQLAGAADGEFVAPEAVFKDLVRCAIEQNGHHGDNKINRMLSELKQEGHKLRYHEVRKQDKKALVSNYQNRIDKKQQVVKSHRSQIQSFEWEIARQQKLIDARIGYIKQAEQDIAKLETKLKKSKEKDNSKS